MQRFMVADPLARRLHRLRSPLLLQQISSKMFAFSSPPGAGEASTNGFRPSLNQRACPPSSCMPANFGIFSAASRCSPTHTLFGRCLPRRSCGSSQPGTPELGSAAQRPMIGCAPKRPLTGERRRTAKVAGLSVSFWARMSRNQTFGSRSGMA